MAQEELKVEKSTNCAGCNKPLRKIKRYYRNTKHYCSKKCWKQSSTAQKKEAA